MTNPHSTFIAFFLPLELAGEMALPDGEAPDDLHLTLAYLGDIAEPERITQLKARMTEWAATRAAVEGEISGVGRFAGEEDQGVDPFYASFDGQMLPEWRSSLVDFLRWNGFPLASEHGFTPHITLAYLPKGAPAPIEQIEPRPVVFDKVTLGWGEARYEFDLLTARRVKSSDLVAYGGQIKALGDGRIGGYLVMWGDPDQTDLEGDYFTPATELMWEGKETRPSVYHHGLDPTLGLRLIGNGLKKVKTDNVGLWVETQLDMRDEYEAAIYKLTQRKKLGFSSGTASHMVIREDDGKLIRWPIVEGSPTPTPAEPRMAIRPLKSLQTVPLETLLGQSDVTEGGRGESDRGDDRTPGTTPGAYKTKIHKGGKSMDLLEILKKLVPDLTDEQIEKISAVMDLSSMQAGDIVDDETMMSEEEEDEGTAMRTTEAGGQRRTRRPAKKSLESVILGALKKAGIVPAKSAPPARPPYTFKPTEDTDPEPEDNGLKSIAVLRYGDTPAGIKAVAKDLYGDGYEVQRLEQHRSFTKYVRHGKDALNQQDHKSLKMIILTPKQIKEAVVSGVGVGEMKTELNNAIGELGHFLVPEDVRLDFIERMPGKTQVRSRADVSTTSSDVMTRVKVTGGDSQYTSAVRVTYVGDTPAQDAADTAPTFGIEKTPIHIVKATVPVPMTILEDSAYPITNKLGEWAANAYAIDEDQQVITGNGIGKPYGMLPGGTNPGTRLAQIINGSTSAIDPDKLIDLLSSLDEQYLEGAVWLMNKLTAGAIRKLKAGDGHYLWEQGFGEGKPDTLLGYPVARTESMPSIATNSYPVLFGNLYEGEQMVDRIGMSLLRDEVTEAEQDIVKFLFRRRYGAQVKGEWALKVLKMATS